MRHKPITKITWWFQVKQECILNILWLLQLTFCAAQNVRMSRHWLTNKINYMCCEGDQQSRHVAALFLKNNFFDLANSIYIHIADVSSSSGGYNYILFKMAMVILLSGHATVPSILIQFMWCHPCKDPGGFCNVVFLFLYPWKIIGMHISSPKLLCHLKQWVHIRRVGLIIN